MIKIFQGAVLFGMALLVSASPLPALADETCVGGGGNVIIGIPGGNVNIGGFGGCGGGQYLATASVFGLPANSIYLIIQNTVFWLLAILGFIGVAAFVIAGLTYLLSTGDEDMIDRAKTAMWYSVLGVIVALVGLIILRAVDAWLRGSTMF
jgi:hypothetical protein